MRIFCLADDNHQFSDSDSVFLSITTFDFDFDYLKKALSKCYTDKSDNLGRIDIVIEDINTLNLLKDFFEMQVNELVFKRGKIEEVNIRSRREFLGQIIPLRRLNYDDNIIKYLISMYSILSTCLKYNLPLFISGK